MADRFETDAMPLLAAIAAPWHPSRDGADRSATDRRDRDAYPNIPSQQAWIELTMLLYVHDRGRTEAEFADLLRRAGFDLVETTAATPALSLLQAVSTLSRPHATVT